MGREILFRGKRTDNDKWVNGLFCEFPCDDGTNIPSIVRIESMKGDRVCTQYPIISETIGQYTGLTDRNGVRIFEGDIVSFADDDTQYKGLVYWDSGSYWIDCSKSDRDSEVFFKLFHTTIHSAEVIGNIHDNPELMEKEK